jgi:GT2 family glycosyltransferase
MIQKFAPTDSPCTNIPGPGSARVFPQGQTIAAIAIGRNEGERLKRCLTSLQGQVDRLVYVDSGSDDDSVAWARDNGFDIVELDTATPFTAARARNVGARFLLAQGPCDYLLFVDGDCAVDPDWPPAAARFLDEWPTVGIVTGWRAEIAPETSHYNAICQVEWHRPAGSIDACGGDMVVRATAFQQVGGFADTLICAEDEDFVIRVRQTGLTAHRIPVPMTLHDAAMTRFGQWWRRSVRAGHGFAEVGRRHPAHYVAERRRVWFWAVLLPLAFTLSLFTGRWGLAALILLAYFASLGRSALALKRNDQPQGLEWPLALRMAGLQTLSKLPNLIGMATYHLRRLRGAKMTLIEYK